MPRPALAKPRSAATGGADDAALLARLRAGEDAAFDALVGRHQTAMIRVAELYVPSRAVAEEVAQETWLAALEGLDRFDGRSSLKTWLFKILTNRAKTRGQRERRSVALSALRDPSLEGEGRSVEEERFLGPEHGERAGLWARPPRQPDEEALGREARGRLLAAIDDLPPAQRTVITLRDVGGWESDSVCDLLDVSQGNQRVLLHRARSKVRAALEDYLEGHAAQ